MIITASQPYSRALLAGRGYGLGQVLVGQAVAQGSTGLQPQSSPPTYGGQWMGAGGQINVVPPLQATSGQTGDQAFNAWIERMRQGISYYQQMIASHDPNDPAMAGYPQQLAAYQQMLQQALANRTSIVTSLGPGLIATGPAAPTVVNPTPPSQPTDSTTPAANPDSATSQATGGGGTTTTPASPVTAIINWLFGSSTPAPITGTPGYSQSTTTTTTSTGNGGTSDGNLIPGVPNWAPIAAAVILAAMFMKSK